MAIVIETSIYIDRPPGEVFDAVADVQSTYEWISAV